MKISIPDLILFLAFLVALAPALGVWQFTPKPARARAKRRPAPRTRAYEK